MIQKGSWLYNKQFLLVMEDTDDVTQPTKVPYRSRNFGFRLKDTQYVT